MLGDLRSGGGAGRGRGGRVLLGLAVGDLSGVGGLGRGRGQLCASVLVSI